MTQTPAADDGQEHDVPVIEDVRDKLLTITCDWCGTQISVRKTGKGRPRRYCDRSCRQRAYEVRTAQARLERDQEAGKARRDDQPVEKLIERTVYRTRLLPPAQPPARDPWQREDTSPGPDTGPPRPRELQRLLARAAAAIAQGEYSYSEVERIMRGVDQMKVASDRYLDAVNAHMRGRMGGGKKKRH